MQVSPTFGCFLFNIHFTDGGFEPSTFRLSVWRSSTELICNFKGIPLERRGETEGFATFGYDPPNRLSFHKVNRFTYRIWLVKSTWADKELWISPQEPPRVSHLVKGYQSSETYNIDSTLNGHHSTINDYEIYCISTQGSCPYASTYYMLSSQHSPLSFPHITFIVPFFGMACAICENVSLTFITSLLYP